MSTQKPAFKSKNLKEESKDNIAGLDIASKSKDERQMDNLDELDEEQLATISKKTLN